MIFSNFALWKQNIKNVNQVNAIAAASRLNLKNDMDSISKYIKEERDVLYLRGQEREQMKFVKNLLTETDFPLDKIAGVSVDYEAVGSNSKLEQISLD